MAYPETIDRPQAKDWGWAVVPFDSVTSAHKRGWYAIAEYPTDNGPADYALAVDGTVLGIVEAKKLTLGPQGVLTQAERYARGLPTGPFDFRGLRAPFLYSTNGEIIWFHDVRNPFSRSRKVSAFHTPAALQELLSRDFDGSVSSLISNTQWHPRLRLYQIEANQAIEQAIAQRQRHASGDGDRHGQDLHNGQRGISPNEVRRRPSHLVPG